MKKLYTLSILLTTALSFAQASDPFNGTGALTSNGWAHHSGTTTGQLVISAGSLTYSGMTSTGNKAAIVAGNSEDVNKASAAPIVGGVAYYSAIINLPNTDGLALNTDPAGNYFLMFGATAGTNVTGFNSRIYVKAGTAAGTFNLGILNGAGGTATPTFTGVDYTAGTPMFVVAKFDFTSNTASLFVNPSIGGTEGAATVTNATGTTPAPGQIASVAIRQAGTALAGTGNIEIDEVRIGTTWAYVTADVLGVKQNTISGLKVYPNPVVNGNLYITTDSNEAKQVVIFDLLGKQVVKTTVNNQAVNVSNLNSGVYMVKITEDGKTATRKLVIQ